MREGHYELASVGMLLVNLCTEGHMHHILIMCGASFRFLVTPPISGLRMWLSTLTDSLRDSIILRIQLEFCNSAVYMCYPDLFLACQNSWLEVGKLVC